jgi:hypothetical protein
LGGFLLPKKARLTTLPFDRKLRRMKTTLLALPLLASLAFASTLAFGANPYVQVTTNNGTVTIKNVSSQAIVLMAGNITLDGKVTGPYTHDFFFKPSFFKPGDSTDFMTTSALEPRAFNYSIVISFIQFDDGTTWGTRDSAAADRIASRVPMLVYFRALSDASGSESSFMTALNQNQTNVEVGREQRRLRYSMNVTGISVAATITEVKQYLAAGTARQNSGKF